MAATNCCLFDEDEVCKKTSDEKFIFGLVVESSEYTNSDDDEDDDEILKKGTVRVAWHPDGKETVTAENKLILTDRSLMPGDVVRRLIKGKNSQHGFVQDMNVKCHLHVKGTNKYIYNVDSRDLCDNDINNLSTKTFNSNPADVTLDSWVGRIEEIHEEITLLFPDGARCKVKEADELESFDAVDEQNEEEDYTFSTSGFYYKGKVLRGSIGDLDDVQWILTTNKHGPKASKKARSATDTVRVEETKVWSVDVYWMCQGLTKVDNPAAKSVPPPSSVGHPQLERLAILDWFGHCSVQIGDKAHYVIKESDVLVDKAPRGNYIPDAVNRSTELSNVDSSLNNTEKLKTESTDKQFNEENKENEGANCVENGIDRNNSKSDETEANDGGNVDDNDDEYEDVESSESENEVDHNVCKSQSTRKRGKKYGASKSSVSKKNPGRKKTKAVKFETEFPTCKAGEKVPVEVCYTHSEACVMWQDGSVEEDVPSHKLFPIHDLDEHEFFPGDFVINSKESCTKDQDYGVVVSCDHEQRICLVKWMKTVDMTQGHRPDESVENEETSVYDIKDHGDFKFRPSQTIVRVGEVKDMNENIFAVGQIWRLDPKGAVFVKWPNGAVTRCYPQELYIVSDEMSDAESLSDGEEESGDESDVSWETESEEEVDPESEDVKHNESIKMLVMTQEKKEELDSLLQRALTALQNLEQQFVSFDGLHVPMAYHHFRGIMTIYRKCQDLEKLLKSSYFEEPEIRDLVDEVKKILQEEKRNEINKKIMHVYETRKCQNKSESDRSLSNGDRNDQMDSDEVVRSEEKECVTNGEQRDSCSYSGASKDCNEDEKEHVVNSTVSEGRQPTNSDDVEGIQSSSSDTGERKGACAKTSEPDLSVSDIATGIVNSVIGDIVASGGVTEQSLLQTSDVVVNGGCGPVGLNSQVLEKGDTATCAAKGSTRLSQGEVSNMDCVVDSKGKGDKAEEDTLQKRRNEFCLKICHQLHIQMMKFQEEINRRWEYTQQKEKQKNKENIPQEAKPSNTSDIVTKKKVPAFEMLAEDCDAIEEVILGIKAEKPGSTSEDMKTLSTVYRDIVTTEFQGFHLCEEVPPQHRFSDNEYCPSDAKSFISSVRKELKLLQCSLPSGIVVKGFENRMDLFSVMIIGPAKTPYEDALFFFDVQLPGDYPSSPPVFHYISYCQDRLNPNLYEDGKVCVSLLGTWAGKGNETWTNQSNLLQVLISIQGLILVAEPYYNEAGYERQRGTQQGCENSKMYNEMAVLKLVQNMTRMIKNPPHSFIQEMTSHLRVHGPRMIERIESWVQMSRMPNKSLDKEDTTTATDLPPLEPNAGSLINSDVVGAEKCEPSAKLNQPIQQVNVDENIKEPDFTLIPASRGFCLTMKKHLEEFRLTLQNIM